MSKEGVSAKDLVNTMSWQELAEIFSRYGEEKYARSIAQGIVRAREKTPIETTLQLAEIVKESVPARVRTRTGSSGTQDISGAAHSGQRGTGQAFGRT